MATLLPKLVLCQFVIYNWSHFPILAQALATSVLPRVIDTKLMAHTAPLRQEIVNSSLEELLRTASLPPYEMPEVPAQEGSCGYSDQSERCRNISPHACHN